MADSWAEEASFTSSSSTYSVPQWQYDVFLSFSGADTRNNFTGHLLAALERHGFHTFRDDTKLRRGEEIGPELLKAIESSRVSLVVFSKNYAASRWCLDELVKIMECRRTTLQIVLPIFYDVDPSDVRSQKGCVAEAFARHEQRFKVGSDRRRVERWRAALSEAANLSGWDLQTMCNGHEAKFITIIVEEVSNKLNLAHLNVADHPVGIESRMLKLNMFLSMGLEDVRIVAVWGIGGIGKTTIAKAVYNLIYHKFEAHSFLANVRETSKQPQGVESLQKQLVSDILRNETPNIRNFHQGIQVIKKRVLCRRVLLVLDDVDNVQQLKDLAIDRGLLCPGSRIIITTRDLSSVNSLEVDEVYTPARLNKEESFQLFSWCAFRKDEPMQEYAELLDEVVDYARGVPLVLEILGSYLSNKSKSEWRSAMIKLKKIPHDDVQGKLKISFDSLSKEEKELFLDIACYFAGTAREFAFKILEGCGSFTEIGIRILVDRCLIKIGWYSELFMHDMLRDMGREIVRQESIKEPGRRSRLWCHEDAIEVLRDCTGTKAVEGLFLNFPGPNDVQVNAKAFKKMKRLRLLNLNHLHLSEGYENISKRLVWLRWNGFPLECIPSNMPIEKLVAIDLRHSNLKEVWKGIKILDKLKFLYLSHCYYLTRTPNFSGLNSLEELLLNDCMRLVEVHESISCLNKLVILDMRNCKNLRKIPLSVWALESLEKLDLSGCSKLNKLVVFEGSPSKSRYSYFSWKLRTKSLESIARPLGSLQGLKCLCSLHLAKCNVSFLPSEIANLISLNHIDLRGNSFCRLPASISSLTRLYTLNLEGCKKLQSLPELPANLRIVDASFCTSLEKVSIQPNWEGKPSMLFDGCPKLVENNFANDFRKTLLDYQGQSACGRSIDIFLRGCKFPKWFNYQSMGPYLSFVVPPEILGWILCVIFASHNEDYDIWDARYEIRNKTKGLQSIYRPIIGSYPIAYQHSMWLSYIPLCFVGIQIEDGDELEILARVDEPLQVKRCGIYLIYKGDHEQNTESIDEAPTQCTFSSPRSTIARDILRPIVKFIVGFFCFSCCFLVLFCTVVLYWGREGNTTVTLTPT